MADQSGVLQKNVEQAIAETTRFRLQGGGSKAFYGDPIEAEPLNVANNNGIINYEPTELVITARCGTPLAEIEQALHANHQMLAFEPPHFAGNATLGGAIASGLAGPARPWGGAPRDSLLGIKLLDGQAQIMNFGGQVMKNVAGYDVSRLMAGAKGTLGILLEASIKILPAPSHHITQTLEISRKDALALMRELARKPAPLRGACHFDGQLYLRLSGNSASVSSWQAKIGGETLSDNKFWQQLRDHQLAFFNNTAPLWRLSLPAATPTLSIEKESLTDWAGAQRWLYSEASAREIRDEAARHNGHAEIFRNSPSTVSAFHPLSPLHQKLQQRLKQQFDPHGLFNPSNF